jgi:hypothetical protein
VGYRRVIDTISTYWKRGKKGSRDTALLGQDRLAPVFVRTKIRCLTASCCTSCNFHIFNVSGRMPVLELVICYNMSGRLLNSVYRVHVFKKRKLDNREYYGA